MPIRCNPCTGEEIAYEDPIPGPPGPEGPQGEQGIPGPPGPGGSVDSVNGLTGVVVIDTDDISDAGATNKYVTAADLVVLSNTSGTNTGDQTSIVGITGTLAEFNTALTGADFATGGGTVTGASSGTNTGDQTITLTGDVTGFGTSSFATTTDKVAITNKTLVSSAVADHILLADASDTDNLKKATIQSIIDLACSSGTYIPVLTIVANLDSVNDYTTQWFKVLDMVAVFGKFDADVTVAGVLTELRISIPFASALTAAQQLGGTAVANNTGVVSTACSIEADPVNNEAIVKWKTAATNINAYFFSFFYRII